MDALGHVLNVQPVGKRAAGIVVIGILGVVDMVLLEGADEALYQAVWGGLTRCGHADLGRRGQQGAVGAGGILPPLVGVVDGRGWGVRLDVRRSPGFTFAQCLCAPELASLEGGGIQRASLSFERVHRLQRLA